MTPAELDTESIGRKAGRGLRWSLLGNVVTKVGSFCMGLVLARLLTPADFGVYAVALAALQLVIHINDVGLNAATVQWRGKLEEMAPTATTVAVCFSVALYGMFWFAAPVVAAVAHVPQATPVLRLLTAVILIDGVTSVSSGALMRTFRQHRLITANLAGLVVNATVAITLAAWGAGALSFAAGQVAGSLVTGVIILIAAKVGLRMRFDPMVARRLMRFGIPLAVSLGVESVLMNADYIIIGNILDVQALGYYLLAFNISTWALSVISSAVRYVSIAGFSRLSEVDAASLSAGVQKTVPLLFGGLVPITVLTATLAAPLVSVLYGGQWLPAAPVLRFLMVLTIVRVLTSFALDILMGAGATRWTLWVNLTWAVALVPALVVATHLGGIRGTAIGHAVVGVVVTIPLTLVALHRVGVRLGPIAPRLARPLLGGGLAAVVALVLARLSAPRPLVQLCVAGVAGLLAYVLVAVPPQRLRRSLGMIRREEAHAVNS